MRHKGDEFTEIYEKYKDEIYKYCYVRLNSNSQGAEDCMQETFIVLYKKLAADVEVINPRAFLYKTANNFILKYIRDIEKRNLATIPIEEYEVKYSATQICNCDEIDYIVLNKALQEVLNDDEQRLLKLKYIDDLTIVQVADQMQISKFAVAKRLQRLREKLLNCLIDESRSG